MVYGPFTGLTQTFAWMSTYHLGTKGRSCRQIQNVAMPTGQVHPAENRVQSKQVRVTACEASHESAELPKTYHWPGPGRVEEACFFGAIHHCAMAEVVEMLITRDSCLIFMALF